MKSRIRVEIKGRNEFWQNAVHVEWDYQFPDRKLEAESSGFLLAHQDWIDDLKRVAAQCFCEVKFAPLDPGRRLLFRKLLARDGHD